MKTIIDQFNNKHTKIAEKQQYSFLKSQNQKNFLVKVWNVSAYPSQNKVPLNFLWNWAETLI